MTEAPLDLRTSLNIMRRGLVVVLVLAVLGLTCGVAFGLKGKHRPSAFALVQLPQQTTATDSPSDYAATQAIIATTDKLTSAALLSVKPPVSADQVKISASAPTSSILRIDAQAPQTDQAVQLAQDVANGYIRFVTAHPSGTGAPTLLQPGAVIKPGSTLSHVIVTGGLGLATGLLVGTIIVFARARRDRRLRRRDEIAAAVGVPVLATVEAGHCRTVSDWNRLLEHFEPSPAELWNLHRVLRYLLPSDFEGKLTVRVVSFADDQAALTVGPQLALAAAELGISADLQPDMDSRLESLRAACASFHRSGRLEQTPQIVSDEDDPWKRIRYTSNGRANRRELVVSVTVLDRSRPEWVPVVGPCVLSLSSGVAVADDLARVALGAAESGDAIDGILLVNPEPGDGSAGVLAERPDHRRDAALVDDYPGDGARVAGNQR